MPSPASRATQIQDGSQSKSQPTDTAATQTMSHEERLAELERRFYTLCEPTMRAKRSSDDRPRGIYYHSSDAVETNSTLQDFAKTLNDFQKALTCLPGDKDVPGNENRQLSKKHGLNIVLGDVDHDDSTVKKVLTALAAPLAFKICEIPWGTVVGAASNVKSLVSEDGVGSYAKSWWNSASDAASKSSKWLQSAASAATKVVASADTSTLLSVGAAGFGVAVAAYGAHQLYFDRTAATTSDSGNDSDKTDDSHVETAPSVVGMGEALDTVRSGMSHMSDQQRVSVLNSLFPASTV